MGQETSYLMKVRLELQAQQLEAQLKTVTTKLNDLGGSGLNKASKEIQDGFRGITSEASNLAGIYTGNRLSGLTSQLTSMGGAVSAIPGPAGLAVGAIAGISTAAVGASVALFEMAKNASDSIKTMGGFQQITGFSAEATSALAYGLSLTGKELSDVQRPIVFFIKLLNEAAEGSDKAQATLAKLGVTRFDNVQLAFTQAAKTIDGTKDAVERTGLAIEGFSARGGPELEKAIHKMGGDFDAFTQKAKDLSVTLTDEDIAAAREFSHEYEKVMYQATLAANKFALAYSGKITEAMTSVSHWLSENKDEWAKWGQDVGDIIDGVSVSLKVLKGALDISTLGLTSFASEGEVVKAVLIGIRDVATGGVIGLLERIGELKRQLSGGGEQYGPFASDMNHPPTGSDGDVDPTTGRVKGPPGSFVQPDSGLALDRVRDGLAKASDEWAKDQEKRKKDREEFTKKDAQAQVDNLRTQLKDVEKAYDELYKHLAEKFGVDKDSSAFLGGLKEASAKLRQEAIPIINDIKTLRAGIDAGPKVTPAEKVGHKLKSDELSREVPSLISSKEEEAKTKVAEADKAGFAKYVKQAKEAYDEDLAAFDSTKDLELAKATELWAKLGIGEDQLARKAELIETEKLQHKLESAKTYRDVFLTDTDEYNKAELDVEKLETELDTLRHTHAANEHLRQNQATDDEKKLRAEKLKSWHDYVEQVAATDEENDRLQQQQYDENQKARSPLAKQLDELKSRMGAVKDMKSSLQELGSVGVQAFEDMADAVGGAVEQWALYGGSVGQALKKALAAELAHMAGVAVVHALYATALGFQRLAEWDFVGAGHAFVSAALWGALAAGAAVGAHALSGGASGGKSAGTSYASASATPAGPTSLGQNQSLGNFTRSTDSFWLTGSQMQARATQQLANNVAALHAKIDGFSPGDVLGRGIRQKPGLISDTNIAEHRSEPGKSRALAKTMGFRG